MASISDLLNTPIGVELISKASKHTSENNEDITSILATSLPLLLSTLKNNVQTSPGAKSLNSALSEEKHQGSLLEKLSATNSEELKEEGGKILAHILGSKQSQINKMLSSTLEVKKESVDSVLKMAAPIILSILGSQKKKERLTESELPSLIATVLGTSSKHDTSFIETILARDKDGSIIDDVSGMILGGGRKESKDESILGGYTGGK